MARGRPCRTEQPQQEGTAEAEAAAEEAHRKALMAERKLAASEWAALRTPRAPPQRELDVLDVVSRLAGAPTAAPAHCSILMPALLLPSPGHTGQLRGQEHAAIRSKVRVEARNATLKLWPVHLA